ncbi:MAG: hypothetical protein CMJ52_06320 [Planctomycetaceae bacterium]|nr:hypothetical protein [Planctomycetaceae bacterium]
MSTELSAAGLNRPVASAVPEGDPARIPGRPGPGGPSARDAVDAGCRLVSGNQLTMAARRNWAGRFGSLVAADRSRFAELVRAETGKPEWETLVAEIMPLVASARWHARRAGRLLADRRLSGRPWWMVGQSARVRRVPLGRVGIIATWNYPVQLLGIQIVQAVMAGNRVIVKPSERSPRSQHRLIELARAAGLPPGVLDTVSPDRESGAALLAEPDLDHLVFTGSTSVGRRVAAAAAERMLPTTLELSGCDSAVVLADADPVLAARSIWNAVVFNAGQTCMAPRRVLVHADVAAAFAAAIVPLAAGAGLRTMIDLPAAETHRRLVEDAVARGGKLASMATDREDDRRVRPQAIIDCPIDAEALFADHFGPLLAVRAWRDESDLLSLHRRGGRHLATSVFTQWPSTADELATRLGGGIVTINDCLLPSAHPATSIAPVGESGWGVSRGVEGLLAMTRPVMVTRTGGLRPPTGEPDPRAKRFLEGLVRWWGRGVVPPPDTD